MKNKSLWVTIGLIVLVLITWFLFDKPDSYKGTFYPGGLESGEYIQSAEFYSPEECVNWAESMRKTYATLRGNDLGVPVYNNDTWECGKNCRLNKEFNIDICETTFGLEGTGDHSQ